MPVEGLLMWKTEHACCLFPCALVAVCEVDWVQTGSQACRLHNGHRAKPNAGKYCRERKKLSGRNSALSISDYSAHASRMPCPWKILPRSRNVHACCLLSGVCDVHYSVLQNKKSCLHFGLGPTSQNHRSVCGACGSCSTFWGASGH